MSYELRSSVVWKEEQQLIGLSAFGCLGAVAWARAMLKASKPTMTVGVTMCKNGASHDALP